MPQPRTPKETTEETPEVPDVFRSILPELRGQTLAVKLWWIRTHVGEVEKTGEVSFKNVQFRAMQEHGLLNVLRPLWRMAGVDVQVGGAGPGSMTLGPTHNIGTPALDVCLTATNVENDEDHVQAWYPNVGLDNADKAANKAWTGAVKYALQKFFLVPTQDLDDNETIRGDDGALSTGGNVADVGKGGTTGVASSEDVQTVRGLIVGEIEGGNATIGGWVQNTLAADYKVGKLDELTPPQLAEFSRKLTERLKAQ